MKINVLKDLCIGCGTCVALADQTFIMNAENKSEVKNPAGNSDEEILNAAKACPVSAIEIFDDQDNKLWPQ